MERLRDSGLPGCLKLGGGTKRLLAENCGKPPLSFGQDTVAGQFGQGLWPHLSSTAALSEPAWRTTNASPFSLTVNHGSWAEIADREAFHP
ncbi:hypothetical protein [Pseudomonas sp. NBRC 111119]|uniref:hypothetical protein n=1 Tax=Pseudomonas sp. NBRC 111119 TaxID=1661034 RepID=UPI0012E327C6|nr:hypothetical protein [Pseudomonas sp. NBRC 111119]